MEGKIPNTQNLVKRPDFTPSVPEIKKMCQIYMYSTNQHSFEQGDNKISTSLLTGIMKELTETRLSKLAKNVLTSDNKYRSKLIYPLLYQVFEDFL